MYRKQLSLSPFLKYINKLKENDKYESLAKAKLSFAKEYNIQYIVIDNQSQLDSVFVPYINKEILNTYTNERFVILDEIK